MSVVVLVHGGEGEHGGVNGGVNDGKYLPLNLYPRIFIVEKPPDFSGKE